MIETLLHDTDIPNSMGKAKSSRWFQLLFNDSVEKEAIVDIHDNTIGELVARDIREEGSLDYLDEHIKPKLLDEDIYTIAATYMYEIIRMHPFWDGNKRTGFTTAGLILMFGNRMLEAEDTEIERYCLTLSEGFERSLNGSEEPPSINEVRDWLENHSRRAPILYFVILPFVILGSLLFTIGVGTMGYVIGRFSK